MTFEQCFVAESTTAAAPKSGTRRTMHELMSSSNEKFSRSIVSETVDRMENAKKWPTANNNKQFRVFDGARFANRNYHH